MDYSGLDYSAYDIADFAADEFFVSWVLRPDKESNDFWSLWQQAHPEKDKVIREARLLTLRMNSRRFRVEEGRKEQLWENIQHHAFSANPGPDKTLRHNGVETMGKIQSPHTFWYKVAPGLFRAASDVTCEIKDDTIT